jgi:hypothetical protein
MTTCCGLAACLSVPSAWAAPGPAVWSAIAELPRNDHPEAHYFAQRTVISGDTIVVDADDATFDDGSEGAEYVYGRTGSVWVEQQLLRGASGAQNGFGGSVALDGDTMLVHGWLGGTHGAAYVFVHEQSWVQQGEPLVSPSPGPPDQFGEGDLFGTAVAVSGDTAVVGAPNQVINGVPEGAAFVFVRHAGVWAPQGSMLSVPDGTGYASFGSVLAVDGDTVLIGAPHNPYADTLGAAYVFVRNGEQWQEQGPALRSGQANNDEFGGAVALSGDTVLIGAQSAFDQQGAAYVFSRSDGVWKQQGAALRPLRAGQPNIGSAVALQGDRAIVAARSAGGGITPREGALFLYTRDASGVWSQQGAGEPVAAASEDLAVGQSVGLSGNDVVVGALGIADGHGNAFTLQVCADPSACQFVDQAGAGGDKSAGGAGGEAGAEASVGGALGGSTGAAGSGFPSVGGSSTGGASVAGSNSGGSYVIVPVQMSAVGGVGGGPAVAVDDRAVASCGCRLAERRAPATHTFAALALLALPCMLRRRLRGAIAKGQPKS